MKLINKTKNLYTLRLDPNEEFISSVQDFCSLNNIGNAWLKAIGSVKELELAYFNVEKKDYDTISFNEFLEIVNITGNISRRVLPSGSATKEGRTLHAHGIFSRADMATLGGHIMKCVISATAEITLQVGEGEMKRTFDEETGLYLLK